jgi:hypothetical protein
MSAERPLVTEDASGHGPVDMIGLIKPVTLGVIGLGVLGGRGLGMAPESPFGGAIPARPHLGRCRSERRCAHAESRR